MEKFAGLLRSKTAMDSPGIRYTVSKNPFNSRAVLQFVLNKMKMQMLQTLSNLSKVDAIDGQDAEDRGPIHNRTRSKAN